MNILNRIAHACIFNLCFIRFAAIALCLMFFSFNSFAQASPKKERVDNAAINNEFTRRYEEIKQKVKDKKILSLDLLSYSKCFNIYNDMPTIEDATNIKREFFKKSADYLKKLSDCKTIIEAYEQYGKENDPKYVEAKKIYDPTLKEFEKFFKEPPKVKGGK